MKENRKDLEQHYCHQLQNFKREIEKLLFSTIFKLIIMGLLISILESNKKFLNNG
jgi:hypothetical protein